MTDLIKALTAHANDDVSATLTRQFGVPAPRARAVLPALAPDLIEALQNGLRAGGDDYLFGLGALLNRAPDGAAEADAGRADAGEAVQRLLGPHLPALTESLVNLTGRPAAEAPSMLQSILPPILSFLMGRMKTGTAGGLLDLLGSGGASAGRSGLGSALGRLGL